MAGSSRQGSSIPSSVGRQLSQDSDDDDDVDSGELWNHRRLQPQQVGYLSLDGGFSGGLSPQPSSSVECERRVSPLDPNLSSAARYSPPPPYNSPIGGIEASLDHPDSPMEGLSHSSSLSALPNGGNSSISSATESLVVSIAHRLPCSSGAQASGSSNMANANSLFSSQPISTPSQPRWASTSMIVPRSEENERPPRAESIWAKQRSLVNSNLYNSVSQPSSNPLHILPVSRSCNVLNLSQPGPSGIQGTLQSSINNLQGVPGSSSNILQPIPQPTPGTSRHHLVPNSPQYRSSDTDTDDEQDSPESMLHITSNSQPSIIRNRLVRLSDGEAEALGNVVSGCEAASSSSIRDQRSPLGSPGTPTDNCIVSSSTGHIDSIPPTPAEFQGNDVSGPSSPASPGLANVAILDSTVDSTSGRGLDDEDDDDDDDGGVDDNVAPANHMQLPVMADESGEISTSASEVSLQHSEDSQDVALLVNPQGMFNNGGQGMFSSGRTSASRFIEQLSLLSQFSSNALDSSLSGVVSDQHSPCSLPSQPHNSGTFLNEPLAIPGPSRAPQCLPEATSRQMRQCDQGKDQPSTSSAQNISDSVEALSSSLPILDISRGIPGCSSASDTSHVAVNGGSGSLEPMVSLSSSAAHSIDNDNFRGSAAHSIDNDNFRGSAAHSIDNDNFSGSAAHSIDNDNFRGSAAHSIDNDNFSGSAAHSIDNDNFSGSAAHSIDNDNFSGSAAHSIDNDNFSGSAAHSIDNDNFSGSAAHSMDNDNLAGSSGTQSLEELSSQSYVLELNDNSLSSDGALSSVSLSKDGSPDQRITEQNLGTIDTDHQSLLEPSQLDQGSLNSSLSLTLASSELNGVMSAAVTLPGSSHQSSPTHHILPAQPDQVSLLVGDGDGDADGEGALLMMVSSNSHSLHEPLTLEKEMEKEDATDTTSSVRTSKSKNSDLESMESEQANLKLSETTNGRESKASASGSSNQELQSYIGPGFWCGECEQEYEHECSHHRIQTIYDRPLRTRAWASLPSQHLVIRKVSDPGVDDFGVFVRKSIPNRAQFGPLEGVLTENPCPSLPHGLIYSIKKDDNITHLDISDERSSNWMRFVRKATTYLEQNCVVLQIEERLFFFTTTDLSPRTELRVGYSKQYADQRNLTALQPTEEEIKVLEALRKTWPCYECDESFETSAELQQHLSCHDEDAADTERKKKKRIKTRRLKGTADTAATKHNKKAKITGEGESSADSSQTESQRSCTGSVKVLRHSQCLVCNLAFSTRQLLRLHKRNHEYVTIKQDELVAKRIPAKDIMCPQCDMKFENENELHTHVDEHGFYLPKQGKPYKCDCCYKAFSRRESLQTHAAVHNEAAKPFQCTICARRFCNSSALTTHLKSHIVGNKGYNCPICREEFSAVVSLKAHVPTHCVNGEYSCPTCSKVFPTYNKIRRHIRSYHAIISQTCSVCGKKTPSLDKLKVHMLSHSDRRDFLCPDCGKRFKRKDKLREHTKRMHSAERASKPVIKAPPKCIPKVDPADYKQFVYKCRTCLLGFKRRGMLVNHLAKRHPNVDILSVPELSQPILKTTRSYSCQYCNKVYRSTSKRKLHIIKNHPGAELPPPSSSNNENENGDGPSYSKTLYSTPTKPHHCSWCYRQYASRARLLRHQRHHHPELCTENSVALKDYASEVPESAMGDVGPLLDTPATLPGELSLQGQIISDNELLRNHRVMNMSRGEPSTAGTEGAEDDLLTQAMGEISPLAGGEYVRLVGTSAEGQQVVVGTTQGTRPLLVSSDGSQQCTALALVTADGPDTVTLSLPAAQFISLIPGLSIAGTSAVTSSSRSANSDGDPVNIPGVDSQDGVGSAGDLQRDVPTMQVTSTLGSALSDKENEDVEQVVLTAHQHSSSGPVMWQQTLAYTSAPT